jgi:preprotein translocase subunit SecA
MDVSLMISSIFGDANKRYVKNLDPIIKKVGEFEVKFEKLSDADIKVVTQSLKDRLLKGEASDAILPEAFALVREAAKRTLNMRHLTCS